MKKNHLGKLFCVRSPRKSPVIQYATIGSFTRPFRAGLAVWVSPKFDAFIEGVQNKLKVPRAAAIGVTVLLANVVCTCSLVMAGITVASMATGVPIR